MDTDRFDALTRTLAEGSTRRHFLRVLFSGATSGLVAAGGMADGTAAARCKAHKDCPGCKRCDRKKGKCVAGCAKGKRCCGGACVDPGLCCESNDDCGTCGICDDGRCRPNPDREGATCGGCLRCRNGICSAPDDELCENGDTCRPSTGICCAKCAGGKCCKPGHICIDDAFGGGDRHCCDASVNTPCGGNGDGTFAACCSNANERCVNNRCVPKDECPSGEVTSGGVCCDEGREACEDRCCFEGDTCCNGTCTEVEFDMNNCGACGNVCDPRTERCHNGACRDRCSLNSAGWDNRCDQGGDYWCCPDSSPRCCRDGDGDPHCCAA